MFLCVLGDGFLEAFGPERAHRLYPYRSLIDKGIRVAGASDSPVAPALPLMGIRDAVLRRTGSGADIGKGEALSVCEAIRLYTSEAGYFSFDEDNMGTIKPEKYADFVILDRDITSIPAEEIADAQVLMTVVGGKSFMRQLLAGRRLLPFSCPCACPCPINSFRSSIRTCPLSPSSHKPILPLHDPRNLARHRKGQV